MTGLPRNDSEISGIIKAIVTQGWYFVDKKIPVKSMAVFRCLRPKFAYSLVPKLRDWTTRGWATAHLLIMTRQEFQGDCNHGGNTCFDGWLGIRSKKWRMQ